MATRLDDDFADMPAAFSLPALLVLLLTTAVGAGLAVIVLPAWLPGLTDSLLGPEPKAYWYLSRSSAFVAFGLLWLGCALGLAITSRAARIWPGGPVAFDLHQHASLLGLAFALFHALILTGDSYVALSLWQVLLPFSTTEYRPVWVGLGQVALYTMALVGLSFYARQWMGRRLWRAIHYLSFVVVVLVLTHGLTAGTDSSAWPATALYVVSAASLALLTAWRVVASSRARHGARASHAARDAGQRVPSVARIAAPTRVRRPESGA